MKQLETVSSYQMASLFLSYMTGSAIIYVPDATIATSKNGAWLSIMIGTIVGLSLLWCFLYVHKQYPGQTFVDISRQSLGPRLFYIVIIPFLVHALIELTYIVIGIGSFFTNVMMKETPAYVFYSLILLTAAVTVCSGIEVMARMFTLLLFVMYIGGIIVILLISPSYHTEYLLPLMPDGIKPILLGAYQTVSFPFAEFLLFSMIIPFVNQESKKKLGKLLVFALLFNGLSLVVSVVCTIMVLGPMSGNLPYSLFQLARLVNIADFIERIESIIGLSLIAGSFMKATIVLYILNYALSKVLKLKDHRSLVFPVALLSLFLALTMFNNAAEFLQAVYVITPLSFIFMIILPYLLITFITLVKRKRRTS
jgi:spore germination protein KB